MKKILLLIAAAFLLPQPAIGCTIPVFRYALEKWDLTTYEIVVFHRGDLPADVQKSLDRWGKSKSNIDITIVDLAGKVAPNRANSLHNVWRREADGNQEPWMQVRYHEADRIGLSIAWSGPCTNATLQNVLHSPKRQELIDHLKGGASTTFILLNGGNEQADKAAYDMVSKQLQLLEKKIKLPVQSKDGPQMKLPLPLKVSLPILTLDRNRAEEAAFVKMLLATEEDLDKAKGPILFPVFGRGRVLGSLYGKDLDEVQVGRATEFLCRECSCQIKELNPGVDLLLAADWSGIFDKMFDAKELELKNIRPSDKLKGPARKDNKFAPGDNIFISFDIENLAVDGKTNKFHYQTTLEFRNSEGKVLFKQIDSKQAAPNGKSTAEDGHVLIAPKLVPGLYSVRMVVEDKVSNRAKAFQYDISVQPAK